MNFETITDDVLKKIAFHIPEPDLANLNDLIHRDVIVAEMQEKRRLSTCLMLHRLFERNLPNWILTVRSILERGMFRVALRYVREVLLADTDQNPRLSMQEYESIKPVVHETLTHGKHFLETACDIIVYVGTYFETLIPDYGKPEMYVDVFKRLLLETVHGPNPRYVYQDEPGGPWYTINEDMMAFHSCNRIIDTYPGVPYSMCKADRKHWLIPHMLKMFPQTISLVNQRCDPLTDTDLVQVLSKFTNSHVE